MLKLMTIVGLQTRNGAGGAILGTGTAMQAVLRFNAIRVSRLDALLWTARKAGAATDTRIGIDAETPNRRWRRALV